MIDHPGHERLSQTRARKAYRFFRMSADATSASLSFDHHHLPKSVTQDNTASPVRTATQSEAQSRKAQSRALKEGWCSEHGYSSSPTRG